MGSALQYIQCCRFFFPVFFWAKELRIFEAKVKHNLEGMEMPEHRKRMRVEIDAFACLRCAQGKFTTRTLNISLRGVLLNPLSGPEPGEHCSLQVALDSGLEMTFTVQVVRTDEDGLGLRFESMDEESFRHLRNFIRFHALDADQVDREIFSHAFEVTK